jgi:hypothetical protein
MGNACPRRFSIHSVPLVDGIDTEGHAVGTTASTTQTGFAHHTQPPPHHAHGVSPGHGTEAVDGTPQVCPRMLRCVPSVAYPAGMVGLLRRKFAIWRHFKRHSRIETSFLRGFFAVWKHGEQRHDARCHLHLTHSLRRIQIWHMPMSSRGVSRRSLTYLIKHWQDHSNSQHPVLASEGDLQGPPLGYVVFMKHSVMTRMLLKGARGCVALDGYLSLSVACRHMRRFVGSFYPLLWQAYRQNLITPYCKSLAEHTFAGPVVRLVTCMRSFGVTSDSNTCDESLPDVDFDWEHLAFMLSMDGAGRCISCGGARTMRVSVEHFTKFRLCGKNSACGMDEHRIRTLQAEETWAPYDGDLHTENIVPIDTTDGEDWSRFILLGGPSSISIDIQNRAKLVNLLLDDQISFVTLTTWRGTTFDAFFWLYGGIHAARTRLEDICSSGVTLNSLVSELQETHRDFHGTQCTPMDAWDTVITQCRNQPLILKLASDNGFPQP